MDAPKNGKVDTNQTVEKKLQGLSAFGGAWKSVSQERKGKEKRNIEGKYSRKANTAW